MSLKNLNEDEFSQLLKSKMSGVVLFGAPWCAACKIIAPILTELAINFPEVSFGEIDVGKNPGLASRMGVMSLPNLFFINNGKIAEQIIGAKTKSEIENKLRMLTKK